MMLKSKTKFQGKDWRDIKGYEGIYEVNELGQIRSYWKIGNRDNSLSNEPQKLLSQRGYYSKKGWNTRACVQLYNGGVHKKYNVARLVAKAFLGLTDEEGVRKEVIHLNGDMMDCRVENLKVTNASERILNYYKNKRGN